MRVEPFSVRAAGIGTRGGRTAGRAGACSVRESPIEGFTILAAAHNALTAVAGPWRGGDTVQCWLFRVRGSVGCPWIRRCGRGVGSVDEVA